MAVNGQLYSKNEGQIIVHLKTPQNLAKNLVVYLKK